MAHLSMNILRGGSSCYEMEKQQREQVEKNLKDAKSKLEREIEDAYREHQANLLHQGLMRHQGEIRGMEELHSQEMWEHKEMQLRQEEEQQKMEEEMMMMIHQCEMEEEMRHQREESYSQMDYMDPSERDMRTAVSTLDPNSSTSEDIHWFWLKNKEREDVESE